MHIELVRSKSNIIRSKAMELSNVISGIPLTYFKDFQEDKKIIFECFDELSVCLDVMNEVIKKSQFNKDKGCLLYTSPSPRDATLSRMPSSA